MECGVGSVSIGAPRIVSIGTWSPTKPSHAAWPDTNPAQAIVLAVYFATKRKDDDVSEYVS